MAAQTINGAVKLGPRKLLPAPTTFETSRVAFFDECGRLKQIICRVSVLPKRWRLQELAEIHFRRCPVATILRERVLKNRPDLVLILVVMRWHLRCRSHGNLSKHHSWKFPLWRLKLRVKMILKRIIRSTHLEEETAVRLDWCGGRGERWRQVKSRLAYSGLL